MITLWSGNAQHTYSTVDSYARSIKNPRDVQTLTRDLIAFSDSEEDRIRAIYTWIISHISYDHAALRAENARINTGIHDILDREKALCLGYAQLLDTMCTLAGIASAVISGYSKGILTSSPAFDRPDHAWNAVKIDTLWHLLDATWGSGILKQPDQFTTEFSEDYFLTPPDLFVLTHLPADPMWQLLDCTIPMSVFRQDAQQILAFQRQQKPCIPQNGLLKVYERNTPSANRLLAYRRAYAFHQTPGNKKELGAAIIDFAYLKKDSADLAFEQDQDEEASRLYLEALSAFREVEELQLPLFDWQREGMAFTFINYATLQYRRVPQTDPRSQEDHLKDVQRHFIQAKDLLGALPENSLFKNSALAQCDQYIEHIDSMLTRAE